MYNPPNQYFFLKKNKCNSLYRKSLKVKAKTKKNKLVNLKNFRYFTLNHVYNSVPKPTLNLLLREGAYLCLPQPWFKRPPSLLILLNLEFSILYQHLYPKNKYLITNSLKGNLNSHTNKKILMLNFKRHRFFPNIQSPPIKTYISLSLGLFAKYFNKGKSFIKNKSTFLVVAGFLRKVLLFTSIKDLILIVKRTPLYLQEVLSVINNPVVTPYNNPFSTSKVDEFFLNKSFYFYFFIFVGSKPYNFLKTRKKGRVKRKITRRLVKINKFID